MPFVNVKVIEGVFTRQQKQEIVERLTDTMVSIEGENLRQVTWVVVEEVKSGEWGSRANHSQPKPSGIWPRAVEPTRMNGQVYSRTRDPMPRVKEPSRSERTIRGKGLHLSVRSRPPRRDG